MEHPFFGTLSTRDTDHTLDVIWEREQTLGGQTLEVALWVEQGQGLDTTVLDAFAALLQDLPALDTQARQHLQDELDDDDGFVRYHLEDVQSFSVLAELAPDGDMDVPEFVQAMQLMSIGLWANDPPTVILDYQMDPEHSDQILALKLDPYGAFIAVDWES